MEDQLVEKASKLFLAQGFKSVTMDTIANEMGISKKTIYQHFSSKPELIKKCCKYISLTFLEKITVTLSTKSDAIEQLIASHRDIDTTFMMDKNKVICELLKYYPDIAEQQKSFHEKEFVHILKNNLHAGIEQELYRPDLNIEFMARFYMASFTTIEDMTYFPIKTFSQKSKQALHLEQYVRSVATPKGLELFLKLIDNK